MTVQSRLEHLPEIVVVVHQEFAERNLAYSRMARDYHFYRDRSKIFQFLVAFFEVS